MPRLQSDADQRRPLAFIISEKSFSDSDYSRCGCEISHRTRSPQV